MAASGPLAHLEDELQRLVGADALRCERVLVGPCRLRPRLDGRRVVSFCSNDYLGLADHRAMIEAAAAGARAYGAGATASRLICGTTDAHVALEEEAAAFVGAEAAAVFSTGYMANVGTITALVGRDDAIVADRLVHASLVDGARLSGAKLARFRHGDVNHLDALLAKHTAARRRLVVTEGLFSMEGDLGPLPAVVETARRHGAIVLVDDAHGIGVLGATGRGALEHQGLAAGDVDVLVGTFGKAMGSFGAFVAGSRTLVEFLKNRARSYIFTTALPPAVVAANRKAIELVARAVDRRERLHRFIRMLRASLGNIATDLSRWVPRPNLFGRVVAEQEAPTPAPTNKFVGGTHPTPAQGSTPERHRNAQGDVGNGNIASDLPPESTPIIPVRLGENRTALDAAERLLSAGFLVQAIRPPTVPEGTARLRVTVSAGHEEAEVAALADALVRQLSK